MLRELPAQYRGQPAQSRRGRLFVPRPFTKSAPLKPTRSSLAHASATLTAPLIVSTTQEDVVKPFVANKFLKWLLAEPPMKEGALCPFDVAAFGIGVVPQFFFYKERLDAEKLKDGLSKALVKFPMFAGRVVPQDGKLVIQYNGSGASFKVSTSSQSLSDILPSEDLLKSGKFFDAPELAQAYQHIPPRVDGFVKKDVPLLYVHLIHFADNASAVMVSIHHGWGDMTSLMRFTEAWVAACNGSSLEDVPEAVMMNDKYEEFLKLIDPNAPLVGKPTYKTVPKGVTPPPPPPLRRVMTLVTKERIAALKDEASKNLPAGVPFISSNDALVARLMQLLGNLKVRGDNKTMSMVFPSDLRARLKDPKNPDQLWFTPYTVGSPVSAAALQELDPTTASLGEIAAASRQAIGELAEKSVRDFVDLSQFDARGEMEQTRPNIDPMTLNTMAIMTTWEWNGEKMVIGDAKPIFHIGIFSTLPARNLASNVPAMSMSTAGGRVLTCNWGKAIADEVIENGLTI